ncbi:MAG TPA: replicative DNA helicase [Caldisericia bacterium]|nr:replicative DNA helicase [Caldisericia bacterium]
MGRNVPFSLEAEQAVLGALLVDPDGMIRLEVPLMSDSFYEPRHKVIFDAIWQLDSAQKPVDLLTVKERLETTGHLGDAGDMNYLMDLCQATPTSANLNHYASIIHDKAIKRRVIDVAERIKENAYRDSEEALEIVSLAEMELSHAGRDISTNIKPIREYINEVSEDIEKQINTGSPMLGLRTKWMQMNSLTSGFQNGDYIIIAGRPSKGKSTLALNIISDVAVDDDKKVLMFSLEMKADHLIRRMASSLAGVTHDKIRQANLMTSAEYEKVNVAFSEIYNSGIFIDETSNLTVEELRHKTRRMVAKEGIDLVVVDYLQLLGLKKKTDNNKHIQVGEISKILKGLAKECNIPVIVLCQLSRAAEQDSKEPKLYHLKDSGSIEQDADLVMLLHDKENDFVDVRIAKQRNGRIGTIPMRFEKHYQKFVEREMVK